MMPNMRAYDVFRDFTTDAGQGNWLIIFGYVPAPFLKTGATSAFSQREFVPDPWG